MKGYGQFCPVAKGAEIFGERWTPLIVRELMSGSHRFNELRRGNPLMSPSMLSQRLKTLESVGVIERRTAADGSDNVEYYLTPAGEDLGPIVMQLGVWGQRWARAQLTPEDYDPALLMWDMRRRIDIDQFPQGRTVVFFEFLDAPRKTRFWWMVVSDGEADLCMKNPGHEVDLHVRSKIETMCQIWMGNDTVRRGAASGELQLHGSQELKRSLERWLGYSVFAQTG